MIRHCGCNYFKDALLCGYIDFFSSKETCRLYMDSKVSYPDEPAHFRMVIDGDKYIKDESGEFKKCKHDTFVDYCPWCGKRVGDD